LAYPEYFHPIVAGMDPVVMTQVRMEQLYAAKDLIREPEVIRTFAITHITTAG